MANYTLTGSPSDSLLGAAGQVDVFFVAAPGRLVGSDTVRGGGGGGADQLRITSATTVTLAAADFANVREIERIVVFSAAGAAITLDDAMVASLNAASFGVFGLAGGETVDGSLVLATPWCWMAMPATTC